MTRRFLGVEAGIAALTGVVALLAAWIAFRLTPESFGQRWGTGGADQVLHYFIFKSSGEVFPFVPNGQLGFPSTQNLFFAPLFDPWSAIFVAVTSWFTSDGVILLNLYLLLSFFIVGVTSVIFFRLLRLRRPLAVILALAFSLMPGHFMQLALGHPFLANYWAVPLIGILVLMIGGPRTNPLEDWIAAGTSKGRIAARRWIPIAALALLVGLTQSYYFVFAALICGGVWLFIAIGTLVARRPLRTLTWPTATVAALALVIVVQLGVLSMNWGDRYEKYFSSRTPGESELYGGKIASLLLPWQQTGVPGIGSISARYFSHTPIATTAEGPFSSVLAIIAMLVTVVLLFLVVLRFEPGRPGSRVESVAADPRVRLFGIAFLWSLFFYLTGGLSVIFSTVVSPEIRAWSRMGVVLALFALAVLGILLQAVLRRTWMRWAAIGVMGALVLVDQLVGVYRGVPLGPTDDSELRSFMQQAQQQLDDDCGVVQLPLKAFPESGNVGDMGDYDEGLPYLYSDGSLRFSYGAVRGTSAGDFWSARSISAQSDAIADSEGCAILVDTTAYTESGPTWHTLVSDAGADPDAPDLESTEGRWLLFDIR